MTVTATPPVKFSLRPFRFSLLVAILLLLFSVYCFVGVQCAHSFAIEPKSWNFRGHPIAYEEAKRIEADQPAVPRFAQVKRGGGNNGERTEKNNDDDEEEEVILILNGFGVGSFHQHRLIPPLLEENPSCRIYCMDYLGQGKSWPIDCNDGNSESEVGLIYSIDTWRDQAISFLEEVVRSDSGSRRPPKVHVVGNSVGGHLAVLLAAQRPDLVASVCLLNATPVWGLNLPGWSGHLPPPALPRRIGRFLFDQIRKQKTISQYLQAAYANPDAFDETLVNQIRSCTEGKGGHAAFASILWSPPGKVKMPTGRAGGFRDCLQELQCDVLLLFGKEDPWCTPAFAKSMFSSLRQRPSTATTTQRYVQLDKVGHCPNHEAPQAVGRIVRRWIQAGEQGRSQYPLVQGEGGECIPESWEPQVVAREVKEDSMAWRERIITRFV